MDSFYVPPAFTAVAGATASNGLAAPVDPSAGHSPTTFNHPPYEEMIFAAITGLKEKDGSSKMAIGKYIERVYSGLPQVHSILLAQHLKRLTSSGALVMVKKSYKLPGSEPLPQNNEAPVPSADAGSGGTLSTAKRGRGRPPKPKLDVQSAAHPMLAALGLADEPVKNGRGRPKKVGSLKRRPGRPPKDPSAVTGSRPKLAVNPAVPNAAITGFGGPKRRPGRPPKNQATPNFVPYAGPEAGAPSGANVAPGRGRPRKTATVSGILGKRRGRPPKVRVAKPRKVSRKPLGRPRKKLATEASDGNWATAYGDAKKKLEYFQSKVQRVVAILKPQLDTTNDDGAAAAMEELDGLATMDIDGPLQEQTPPPASYVVEAPTLQT